MVDDLPPPKKPRGFATMSPEQRREIASQGGKAVAAENRSFSRDKALAKAAGKKGGDSADPTSRAFFQDRELARAAGKIGGAASQARRRKQEDSNE